MHITITICFKFFREAAEISLDGAGYEEQQQNADNSGDQMFAVPNLVSRDSRGTRASTTYSAATKQLDVEELEMLLEAYFVQIDGTLNKLSTVLCYALPLLYPFPSLFCALFCFIQFSY